MDIDAHVGTGLIILHAIRTYVVGGRWGVALCFPTSTEVTGPFRPGLSVVPGDGSVRD